MTVREAIDIIDRRIPLSTQEAWDNSGLIIGRYDMEISRVVVALDAVPEAARYAAQVRGTLLVTHHPAIFAPVKTVTDADWLGETLLTLAEGGCAMLALHTCFDKAQGGTDDTLAGLIGITAPAVLSEEGYGRIGSLGAGMTARALADRLAEVFGCGGIRVYGDENAYAARVASCAGAGGEFWGAAQAGGADVFVTGEIKYHEAIAAAASGLTVIELGHGVSEAVSLKKLKKYLETDLKGLSISVYE